MSWRAIDTWVFDLDNTLYPESSALYDAIGARMTAHIARALSIDDATALDLRERYFHQYGATVAGLERHHAIAGSAFLHDVHLVDYSVLAPDPELNAMILALQGRRIVFTNGGGGHGQRVLTQLGLGDAFERVYDIEDALLSPKPEPAAYARLIETCGLDPARCVLVEDTLRNLAPAHALGFMTVLVGPAHPAPLPAYVDHHANDLKTFLRWWSGSIPGKAKP